MRPRPDAAENVLDQRGLAKPSRASMRPRPDAAENAGAGRVSGGRRVRRFNEAAARCRGKRRPESAIRSRWRGASMRPRPDAAENGRASRAAFATSGTASMRPRPDAAENIAGNTSLPASRIASMRPRPDAAENTRWRRRCSRRRRCFNEAAARCRGKQGRRGWANGTVQIASMRPRPDAAENSRPWPPRRPPRARFNEAAARCRGKPAATR